MTLFSYTNVLQLTYSVKYIHFAFCKTLDPFAILTDTKYRYTPDILCFCIERAFYKSRPLLSGIDNLGVRVSKCLSIYIRDELYL